MDPSPASPFQAAFQTLTGPATTPSSDTPFKDAYQTLAGVSEQPQEEVSQDPWQNFTQKATQIAQERNYPVGVLLGQAALESGRGTSNFARGRNNFFGYQAYDSNPDAAATFNSPEQGINTYIDLITQSPRYAWAYQQYLQDHDAASFVRNIWQSGYATDPNYANKVISTPEFQGGGQ